MRQVGRVLSFFVFTAMLTAAALVSCGSSDSGGTGPSAPVDASDGRSYPYTVPDAPCKIVIDQPPELPRYHVTVGTVVDYDSNPPSSGPHYEHWAAFQEFTTPVDRRYYVHDLEHGAIVFTYLCADDAGGCQDVRDLFHSAVASLPNDATCLALHEGVRVRTVITPDPLLDVPIAASAWGWTYQASCIDLASLEDFVREHYRHGPEDFCNEGLTSF
ncbi:MAG TPA: DUF3105 domain-containing protein [Polyangiaceae bacterium]|nr:DUF3105 domain-containing protein [Polyangiaceae bacterium]